LSSEEKYLEPLLNKAIVFKYKFGFAGEAYIDANGFEEEYYKYEQILDKYFSYKKPFYCNRNMIYYSKHLTETVDLIKHIILDAPQIVNSEILHVNKQFIIFSLTEHMLSCVSKMIGIVFNYTSLRNNYYKVLKTYLLELTDYIVKIIFDEELKEFPIFSFSLIDDIWAHMKLLNIVEVREYSEMDNVLTMLVTYFAISDYIGAYDVIISPLQGAALIPPFFISMEKYINMMDNNPRTINYEYVRFSRYDNTYYCESTLSEQVQLISTQYMYKMKVILIDDNTGTAITLTSVKKELSKRFKNVSTCALEYYWEAKIHNDTYPAFQFEDIDLITPVCYRHFKVLNEQIDYIKNSNKLHERYIDGKFNKLNMIYDEIDYRLYINNNCADETVKARLLTIYERFKYIVDTMCKEN